MVTYISRDYSPVNTGYFNQQFGGSWGAVNSGKFYTPIMYHLSLFLTKILGFTTIGQTSWNIDNANIKSLVVSAATNTAPITVTTVAEHNLLDGYVVNIQGATGNTGANGTWKVNVVNSTQFTLYGSFGNGVYSANSATMTSGFQYASGSVIDGNPASINFGASFFYEVAIPINRRYVSAADVGKPLVLKSTIYPTKNSGIFKISGVNLGNTTTIAAASNGQALPQATINVASTTGFPTSGTIFIATGTTIAAASNGASLPQATINVASTSGFPTSGTIFVVTSTGTSTVTYTGTTGTTFTGCTGGTGTMTTGNSVTNPNPVQTITYTNTTGTSFTGCTGGVGTLATGAPVTNLNRYVIDYRSTDTPPPETNTIDWWLYENDVAVSGYLVKFVGGNFNISSSTNATPIVVTTDTNFPNTWFTGQQVTISGHNTNTNANGTWTITKINSTQFSLNGSVGNGAGGATGTASLNGYLGGTSAAANSRVIFQSPHSSAWQVRLCAEPESNNLPRMSVSMGYGGNSIGEFPPFSKTTNVVEYFGINPSSNTTYTNAIPGLGTNQTASRMTMLGDGYGQSVFMYTRTLGATNNGILTFGISDNEPVLVPAPDNSDRLFLYGGAPTTDSGTIIMRIGTGTNIGNCMRNGVPELGALTGWANLDGTSATSPLLSSNAGDSPFTSTTEVLPVEVWSSSVADPALSLPGLSGGIYTIDHRFMGTWPNIRIGRTNFTTFTLTTESTSSFTVSATTGNAVSPIQITTVATNALVTGQTVVINGVTGNTAANGTFTITVIDNTHFTLNGTTGNGSYTGGGSGNGCPRFLHLQNGIYLLWNGAAGLTA